jgi:hypothetical protein
MITCEHCGKVYRTTVMPVHCRCGGVTGYVHEPPTAEYNHWAPLHYYAVKHRANWDRVKAHVWYWNEWVPNIPKSCGCRDKWIELDLEPDLSSPAAFFEWAHHAHDRINVELGKKVRPTLAQSYAIWWPAGSAEL